MVYFRDSGILHSLLNLPDAHALQGHPRVGASWEGFALKQVLRLIQPTQAFFWATHGGAELDLFLIHRGNRYGFEFKFNEAPTATKSIHMAVDTLQLRHLWIVYPGPHRFPIGDKISAWPLRSVPALPKEI